MPSFRSLLLMPLWLVLIALSARAGEATAWTPVEWHGERAWKSSSAGWTAIVSQERSRLISLTPAGGGDNLLFDKFKNERSWSGHRFWLGPQEDWREVWPPPSDWEYSPAEKVDASGRVLRLTQSHADAAYPVIVRTYEWVGGALRCAAGWSGKGFYGIHILDLPSGAVVRVRREVSATAPLGYVLLPIFRRDRLLTDREVSPAVARVSGGEIALRYAGVRERIGVPAQDIVAEIGRYRLILRRGRMTGMSAQLPDLGMVTQVYLGDTRDPFTEIEQISPFSGEGAAVAEIWLIPSMSGAAAVP